MVEATTFAPALQKAPATLPQLAEAKKTVADAVLNSDSVMEPKFDGWRLLWIIGDDGKARSFTRTGKEQTGKLPAIEAELARVLPPGSIVDGEAVAFEQVDGQLRHKWGRVQEVLGSGVAKAALGSGDITLVLFDLLAHGGIDARPVEYRRRREMLEQVFLHGAFDPCVTLVPQLAATEEAYEHLLALGYEGAMVKRENEPYRSNVRGKGWFKVKAAWTADVVVMGYKPGENGFAGLVGAVEFGQHDENGILVHRGRCSGMDYDVRLDLTHNQQAYLGRVFEVAHNGVMPPHPGKPYGAFRHPQWKRVRDDRTAESVVIHDG